MKLLKKRDLGYCSNWKGITLLSFTEKILSRIVLVQLSSTSNEGLRQQQAGFRPGRPWSDHIFTLLQILKQSKKWNSPLYINFIDLEKAFDSIHRKSLWKILRHYGIPEKLVRLQIKSYLRLQITSYLRHGAHLFRNRVKQGCILSAFFFILGIDWIMKKSMENTQRSRSDDISLVSHRHQDMQAKKLQVFQNRCVRRFLRVYWPNSLTNTELHRRTDTQAIPNSTTPMDACSLMLFREWLSAGFQTAKGRGADQRKIGAER